MLKYKTHFITKQKLHILNDYNLNKVNYSHLNKLLISYIKSVYPHVKKTTICKYEKQFTVIMSLLIANSRLHRIKSGDEKDKQFSIPTIIPANPNFYYKKLFIELYPNYAHTLPLIEKNKLTITVINNILKFLVSRNIITVDNGKERDYKKVDFSNDEYMLTINDKHIGSRDNSLLQLSGLGEFRKATLNHPTEWNCKEISYLQLMEELNMLKLAKKSNNNSNRINRYRDKSLTADKQPHEFNINTLKYVKSKTNDYFESTKNDDLEKQMQILNKYYYNISPLLAFNRTFGKDSTSYGRLNSPINQMTKNVRKEVNKCLGITEELDIKSCVPNTLCLAVSGEIFKDIRTNDDIYMSLILNIDGINKALVKSEDFYNKLNLNIEAKLLSGDIKFSHFHKNKSFYVDIYTLKAYRPLAKEIFMAFFGNNTSTAGKKSIIQMLVKTGLYIAEPEQGLTSVDENKLYAERVKLGTTKKIERTVKTKSGKSIKRIEDIDELDFEKWKLYCIDNDLVINDKLPPRFRLGYTDILEGVIKTFSGIYSDVRDLVFTNIYPVTQNIESELLIKLLTIAMENKEVITHAHDCIFVSKDRYSFYKEKQETLFRKLCIVRKEDLFNLKKYNLTLDPTKNILFHNIQNTLIQTKLDFEKELQNHFKTEYTKYTITSKKELDIITEELKHLKSTVYIINKYRDIVKVFINKTIIGNKEVMITDYDDNLKRIDEAKYSVKEIETYFSSFLPNDFFNYSNKLILTSNLILSSTIKDILNNVYITILSNTNLNKLISKSKLCNKINYITYNIKYWLFKKSRRTSVKTLLFGYD